MKLSEVGSCTGMPTKPTKWNSEASTMPLGVRIFAVLVYIGAVLVLVSALACLGLKLCGAIHWSWLWVTAPLWIGGPLLVLLVGCAVACQIVADHGWQKIWDELF